ncbi:MAG: zinc ribbon domain-containing protein [Ruminococcus sp.]|nr:zinc ribbon domain-containing protein [Ruminococcus sp.]
MPHLDDFIKEVMDNGVDAQAPHQAEIKEMTKVIAAEEASIEGEYEKIGRLYYELHSDRTDGELGKLVAGVNASRKKIRDSKMKIGELFGYTFCEECGEQVDEDALFCNNCGAKMPVKLLPGMVLCKHCNKAVREGIRFCTNCGHSMAEEVVEEEPVKTALKTCSNCGFTTDDPEMLFCEGCGRRFEDPAEAAAKAEVPKEPTKKVCTNCGFTIFDADTMFCNDCGRRLVEESELKK